ncbi:MlaD family protein [Aureliella helgolandensis]|uniref:Paraquat-inducible protein B n=1 Tax=Aureliella helgolandensis TaxID=2527968 RepID=A0A518G230_9BACT|nr:MlaD family protein [Aureliella helgolandensis]QDV22677.1 Paraquat-inducible protein B [Aureliella helgolandensis]
MTEPAFPSDIPQASLRSPQSIAGSRLQTRLWWLTGICVLLAIGLTVQSFQSQGLSIRLHFDEGHGLKPGDTLRYRGIDVGSVTSIDLTEHLEGVQVKLLIAPGNESLAVAGSQFWIQRPRLQLGQISGLETVLGAKFIGVLPGPSGNARQTEFTGLETPLSFTDSPTAELRIQFPAGEGLEVGNPVRYRGISVGEVTEVELSASGEAVWVGVRLTEAARNLAQSGTQFWIERPRLDLTEIRGIETLLGGRYIAMQPSGSGDSLQTEFVGLAEPPPLPRQNGSLEIELDAPRRLGLVRSAPVTYRGLEVGRVSNVELASDGASVKVSVTIEAEYAELVRENSKWWAIGGITMEAKLSGVTVSMESLSSWIRGGIAFATPESPGSQVVTGHRFMLEAAPQEEWLNWQPRIAVNRNNSQELGLERPQPVRVVASWRDSILGLYRRRTIESWAIALDDGTLRIPASFIAKAIASQKEVQIELAGESFDFDPLDSGAKAWTDKIAIPDSLAVSRWSRANMSTAFDQAAVFLIVNPELREPIALNSTRVAVNPEIGLDIAPGVAIPSELSGSPVISAATGKLYGLLIDTDTGWHIAKL